MHSALRKELGDASRVMPSGTQWWIEDQVDEELIKLVAQGPSTLLHNGRDRWCWRAMIMQPEPLAASVVNGAIEPRRRRCGPSFATRSSRSHATLPFRARAGDEADCQRPIRAL